MTDDILYGVDTKSFQPAGNPQARLLNRTGWPWFGDEMELLLNARPDDASAKGVVGNASQWQMVVNTIKSRLGGYGVGGLMEGEPRCYLPHCLTQFTHSLRHSLARSHRWITAL